MLRVDLILENEYKTTQNTRSIDVLFLFCVFTHVASIYANLCEQKKAFA